MPHMTVESELHDAVWRFHDAIQRRDGVEDRVRRGDHDPALYDRGLSAAEAVVQARLRLYRVLIEQGWSPPRALTTQVAGDLALLEQPDEAAGRPHPLSSAPAAEPSGSRHLGVLDRMITSPYS
jgi:hypothetical protein